MLKPDKIIIYHHPCSDGFTAAWLIKRFMPGWEEALLHPTGYGQAPPVLGGLDVAIVDFSYPYDEMKAILGRANKLWWYNHHKTAEDTFIALSAGGVGPPFWGTFNKFKCGAMLVLDEMLPESMNKYAVRDFVAYVQDRDLWKWKLPNSKEINAVIQNAPFELECWDDLGHGMCLHKTRMVETGAAILRYQKKMIDLHLERAVFARMSSETERHTVPLVNCSETTLVSELGHRLCEEYPSHDFSATWYYDGNHVVVSLRTTNPNMDVSEVAKYQGGGGHPKAAGFQTNLEWIQEAMNDA